MANETSWFTLYLIHKSHATNSIEQGKDIESVQLDVLYCIEKGIYRVNFQDIYSLSSFLNRIEKLN